MIPILDEECWCYHEPYQHDDGFGCTVPDCDCLAGWTFASLAAIERRDGED